MTLVCKEFAITDSCKILGQLLRIDNRLSANKHEKRQSENMQYRETVIEIWSYLPAAIVKMSALSQEFVVGD